MNISCAMTDAILLYYNIKFEISQYDFHEFYTKKTGEKPPENKKQKTKIILYEDWEFFSLPVHTV